MWSSKCKFAEIPTFAGSCSGASGNPSPLFSCDLEFLPSFDVAPNALKTGEAKRLVAENLVGIESRIRLHPENSLDYLFWSEADVTGGENAEVDAA